MVMSAANQTEPSVDGDDVSPPNGIHAIPAHCRTSAWRRGSMRLPFDRTLFSFARLNEAVRRFRRNPAFIFGRFWLVRSVHAKATHWRQTLFGAARTEIGDLYRAPAVELKTAPSSYVTSPLSPEEHVREVRARSFSAPIQLMPEAVQGLQQCARTWPLQSVSRGKQGLQVDAMDYAAIKANPELYQQTAIARVSDAYLHPVVQRLAGDPFVTELATRILGYKPRRVSSWLFWSFANDLSDEERRERFQTVDFHYDVDGFSVVYFSFYLLEINGRNGAHALVEGTHSGKKLRHLLGSARIGDEEAAGYGKPIRILEGPPGFGFVEDPSCFHRALPPLDGERLMLQLRYH
jgi:hypothetical protein